MNRKNIIIFLGLLLIIILNLYIFFSTRKSLKNNSNPPHLKPTSIINNRSKIYPTFYKLIMTTITPTSIPEEKNKFYQEKISPKLILFNQNEISRFKNLINQTPIDKENHSIFYSPLLNKVYFKPKNKQGEKEIEEFIRNYQLESLINEFPQNFIIDKNITSEKINSEEINFLENQEKNLSVSQADYYNQNLPQPSIITNTPQIYPLVQEETKKNSFDFLVELFKILLSNYPSQETILENNSLSPTLSLSPPPSTSLPKTSINNLSQLFDEVGKRVGVPPKILEGVMTIEMPSTFKLSPEQIALYSQPGNRIPNCGPNHCSATGPMQMTIGVDNSGSPRCLSCGLTSCPNAWASYGRSVNIFTNDNHPPDPCNLKDNVYAAAYKLKTDSGATDALNWNQEQVYRAARRYYGSCTDKYRFSRFGNRTYCEFLWWYYNNK